MSYAGNLHFSKAALQNAIEHKDRNDVLYCFFTVTLRVAHIFPPNFAYRPSFNDKWSVKNVV